MSQMMTVLISVLVLVVGGLIGWLIGGRSAPALKAERDLHLDNFKKAITDLEGAVRERDSAKIDHASLLSEQNARAAGYEERLAELREAKDALTAQFSEIGGRLLGEAQTAFLERAEARFKQSEETSGQGLKALLQPVTERLQRYEETVSKVEAERRDAFGDLKGQIEAMRISSESVRLEFAAQCAQSARSLG
jgi:DNA recombination protein RmuC